MQKSYKMYLTTAAKKTDQFFFGVCLHNAVVKGTLSHDLCYAKSVHILICNLKYAKITKF